MWLPDHENIYFWINFAHGLQVHNFNHLSWNIKQHIWVPVTSHLFYEARIYGKVDYFYALDVKNVQ